MLEGEKKCTYSKKKFMASEVLRSWKKRKQTNKTYCWFASDVMLVVFRCKNKSISLLWELNYLRKKIIVLTESRIDHQHGRLVTWLQAKNINHPPPAARLVPLEPPPQAFPRLSGEHTKAGDKKEAREVAWNSSDCFESFSPLYWGSNNDSKESDEIQATQEGDGRW